MNSRKKEERSETIYRTKGLKTTIVVFDKHAVGETTGSAEMFRAERELTTMAAASLCY